MEVENIGDLAGRFFGITGLLLFICPISANLFLSLENQNMV